MYRLLYISQRRRPVAVKNEIDDILAKSIRNNMRLGVTGALFVSDKSFVQVLEGDRASVEAIFACIRVDPRHHAVTLLRDGEYRGRWFGNWSMAYVDLDDPRGEGGGVVDKMADDDVLALLSSLAVGKAEATSIDALLVEQLSGVRDGIAGRRHAGP